MLGRQFIFSTYSKDVLLDLRRYIAESLRNQREVYGFDKSRINHIIITSIPLKLNLLYKYKVDTSNRKEIRNFIDANFSSKTIIPITVNPVLLGG